MDISNSSGNISESFDSVDFVKNIENLLNEGNVDSVLKLFLSESSEYAILNGSWDLIPIITKHLTHDSANAQFEVYNCCQSLLEIIAKKSNPEEALLQFIEEIEEGDDDEKFMNLLKPSRTVLKRVSVKKINSFAWVFSAIQSYLKKLPPPDDHILIEEERLLIDCDANFQRIASLYNEVILFYQVFVDDIEHVTDDKIEYTKVLIKYVIQLLGKPLSHLDMEYTNKTVGEGRQISEKILALIFKLTQDPYIFLDFNEKTTDYDFETPSDLSVAVLIYLIICDEKYIGITPKVYNPVFIFQNSLKLVSDLLSEGTQFCVEKGISLITHVLNLVKYLTLSYLLLGSIQHSRFCKSLAQAIVFNQVKEIRIKALEILRKYLYSFELHGRYLIICNIMNILNHTGLIGFIITTYKDMLLNETTTTQEISVYFKGEKLWIVLSKFCNLPKKEESDLIELSDQIVAALNLLRFLAICDQTNSFSFRKYLPSLQKSYLDPLKKAILLSRSHYELTIKQIQEEIISKDPMKNSEVSVVACGQILPDMPCSEKINVLRSFLTAIDVMDSLLCRLLECININ